jgi:hypothetical protein
MADDYDGEEDTYWRATYGAISCTRVHAKYQHALIVLAKYSAYPRPVRGSPDRRGEPYGERRRRRPRTALPVIAQSWRTHPGNPRVAEQQAKADELTVYLSHFGPDR